MMPRIQSPPLLVRNRFSGSFHFTLFVLLVIAFSCHDKREGPSLETVEVRHGDMEVAVSAPGKIVPKKQITIKSKAAGEIKEIMVEQGEAVNAGQLLLRLDPREEQERLEQARAEHKAAQAELQKARIELSQKKDDQSRGRKLLESGIISKAEYETRARAANLARNNLVIAQSREQSAAHALSEAEDRLSYTEVRAPMHGVILNLDAAPGQVVSSGFTGLDTGTPLMIMADLSRLMIVAEVEETDVAAVSPDQEARIMVDAFPGATFSGRVERVSPEAVERGPVTIVEVEIALEDKGAGLRPGMSATVEIVTARRENALLVPVPAVRDREGRGVVVIKDGQTAWQPVQLGPGDWERVVVEDGLTADQVVVLPPGVTLP